MFAFGCDSVIHQGYITQIAWSEFRPVVNLNPDALHLRHTRFPNLLG